MNILKFSVWVNYIAQKIHTFAWTNLCVVVAFGTWVWWIDFAPIFLCFVSVCRKSEPNSYSKCLPLTERSHSSYLIKQTHTHIHRFIYTTSKRNSTPGTHRWIPVLYANHIFGGSLVVVMATAGFCCTMIAYFMCMLCWGEIAMMTMLTMMTTMTMALRWCWCFVFFLFTHFATLEVYSLSIKQQTVALHCFAFLFVPNGIEARRWAPQHNKERTT